MLDSPLRETSGAVVSAANCSSPCWLPAAALQPQPSAIELDWLGEEGSLTRRLTALAGGDFHVELLAEGWQGLRADECQALGCAAGSEGWVREVLLCGRGEPWVFARSVAARQALQQEPFALDQLGVQPLGHLLFSDHAFQRGPIETCLWPAQALPLAQRHAGLLARRSLFRRGVLGVLVAEVFLPALWQATEQP